MGMVADIRRTLGGHARAVMREHLARGPNEARAFAFMMIGNVLIFFAQLPRLAREVELTGDELARLAAYDLLAWVIIWPLVFYLLAAVAHLVSRAMGGQGALWSARLAMFWSWLAAAPLGLLTGLLAGLTGPSVATNVAGAAWLVLFFWLWSRCQAEASHAG